MNAHPIHKKIIEVLQESEADVDAGVMNFSIAEMRLARAKALLLQGANSDALALCHEVLVGGAPAACKVKALEIMADMADPASLEVLETTWESSRSILSDYKALEPEVLRGMAEVGGF